MKSFNIKSNFLSLLSVVLSIIGFCVFFMVALNKYRTEGDATYLILLFIVFGVGVPMIKAAQRISEREAHLQEDVGFRSGGRVKETKKLETVFDFFEKSGHSNLENTKYSGEPITEEVE